MKTNGFLAEDLWARFIVWFYGWPYIYPSEFRGLGYCKTWPTRFKEDDNGMWNKAKLKHYEKTCRCFI